MRYFYFRDKARIVLEQAQKDFAYAQKKFEYEDAIENRLTSIRNGLEMAKNIHLENSLQQGNFFVMQFFPVWTILIFQRSKTSRTYHGDGWSRTETEYC
jgi:hypothetical protein